MSTTTLPQPGSTVTIGKRTATIIRHGCATDWADCPHGDRAITVQKDGEHGTTCHDGATLSRSDVTHMYQLAGGWT